jgi:hypothetical protein
MRKFFLALLCTLSLVGTFTPMIVHADPGGDIDRITTDPVEKCVDREALGGVLIKGRIKDGEGFACYVSVLLKDNMPYVLVIAILIIVASGIQYMFTGGAGAKQAKERIVGVLGGFIFYLLLRYILPLIATGLTL